MQAELTGASLLWKRERANAREKDREAIQGDIEPGLTDAEKAQQNRIIRARLDDLSEQFDEQGEMHLAAQAGGGVSPLATDHPALQDVSLALAEARVYIGRNGPAIRIHSSDDGADFEGPDVFCPETLDLAEQAAQYGDRVARDSEFIFHTRNRTGEIITAEAEAKKNALKKKQHDQSVELALALTAAGVPAFDKAAAAQRPCIVDPIGRRVIPLTPFRRINFIPDCAAQRRRPMLRHLEAFISANPFAKMPTFTHGPRVPLAVAGSIRDAIGKQHRALSKLNASRTFKAYRARLQFRATELGTLYRACEWPRRSCTAPAGPLFPETQMEQGDPGTIWAHIHSHCFLTFDKYLPDAWRVNVRAAFAFLRYAAECDEAGKPELAAVALTVARDFIRLQPLCGEYSLFLRAVKREWSAHWDAGKTVLDVREACKYPVKPSDMAAARMTNDEVKMLWEELRGLRLVTPMGGLKDTIRDRRAKALKGMSYRNAEGALELRFRPDPNAHGPRDLELLAHRARVAKNERDISRARFEYAAGLFLFAETAGRFWFTRHLAWVAFSRACWILFGVPQNWAERARNGRRMLKEVEKFQRAAKPRENQIVARLTAAPYFDRLTRPALLMWRFDGDFDRLAKEPLVKTIIEAAAPGIAKGLQDLQTEAALSGLSAPVFNTQSPHQSHNCPRFEEAEA